MTVVAEIGSERRGLASCGAPSRADAGRLPGSAEPTGTTSRAVRQIDDGALNEVVDRAVMAVASACDVSVASAIDGRLDYRQPERRDPYFKALTDVSILVAARVLHPDSCREVDVAKAEEIANRVCSTFREATAFLALSCERAASIASQPRFWDCHGAIKQRLADGGGWWDLKFRAPRDTTPLIQIEPIFNIEVPAPIVNIAAAAPAEPAIVNVTVDVPPQPDKHIVFDRNFEGEIVSATSGAA